MAVRFSVKDTGTGIDPSEPEQIFEDFVALSDSEGRQSRVNGLGLSISNRIARKLGGNIKVMSGVTEGSTFTLTVPLKRRGSGQHNSSETPTIEQSHDAQPMRILVVEDNNINRNVLRDMLEGLGHIVVEPVNCADCLMQAEDHPFYLLYMAISMPIMDGREATKSLRTGKSLNADTHIVGLPVHGHEEYREKGHKVDMNRFHTKPIRMSA